MTQIQQGIDESVLGVFWERFTCFWKTKQHTKKRLLLSFLWMLSFLGVTPGAAAAHWNWGQQNERMKNMTSLMTLLGQDHPAWVFSSSELPVTGNDTYLYSLTQFELGSSAVCSWKHPRFIHSQYTNHILRQKSLYFSRIVYKWSSIISV